MRDGIYLIKFKTEGVDQESDSEEGGDGKGGKPEEDGNPAEEDLLDGDLGKNDDDLPLEDDNSKEKEGSQGEASGKNTGTGSKSSVRGSQVVRNLFCYLEEDPKIRGHMSDADEMTCINLLKAMELEEYNNGMEVEVLDNEVVEQAMVAQEGLSLPEERTYSCMGQTIGETSYKMEEPLAIESAQPTEVLQGKQVQVESEAMQESNMSEIQSQCSPKPQAQMTPVKAKKKKVWGPIQPLRRSKRQP